MGVRDADVPRNSLEDALRRREQVEHLELRGGSVSAIARTLHADRRTITRDLRALAAQRAERTDVAAARLRLLEAAQVVERTGWELFTAAAANDPNTKLGALSKVLAAHSAQTALLGQVENATLAAEVAELRDQVAALQAERPTLRRKGQVA